MGRRSFTAEFKAKVVLEVLREERELSVIAADYQINPNQIRAWKKSFLDKAPTLFEESKQAKQIRANELQAEQERAAMLETIGQLTLERDFLQKQALKKKEEYFFRSGRKK